MYYRVKDPANTRGGGYTIVETLIFLAVSSAMFVSAMLLISGQQNKAQFVNAVRDFEAQLRDVANNTFTGYYNRPDDVFCKKNAGGDKPEITTNSSDNMGECMLVGTFIKLGNGASDEEMSKFSIIPMVGLRSVGGMNTDSLAKASPQAVSSAAETKSLLYGATFGCIEVESDGAGCKTGSKSNAGLGFFSNLSGSNDISNGAIRVDYINVGRLMIGNNLEDTTGIISKGTNILSVTYDSAFMTGRSNKKTIICINSGTTNQRALFRVSGGGCVISEIQGGKCDSTVS